VYTFKIEVQFLGVYFRWIYPLGNVKTAEVRKYYIQCSDKETSSVIPFRIAPDALFVYVPSVAYADSGV